MIFSAFLLKNSENLTISVPFLSFFDENQITDRTPAKK